MGPSSLIQKTVHYGFASILEDSIQISKKDWYPLPLISDPPGHAPKARVLHQDRSLTCVPLGPSRSQRQMENCIQNSIWLFQVVGKCPEGLTNAPAAFQWFYEQHFHRYDWCHGHHLLGRHFIYSGNMSEQQGLFQEVLRRLRANGLFVRADKCEFHITSCDTLVYAITTKALPWTVQSDIQDWHEPRKVKDIQCSSVCQLLPTFHLWILWNHPYPSCALPKGYNLELHRWMQIGFWST